MPKSTTMLSRASTGSMEEAVRWAVLHAVFADDPQAWIDYLLHRGSQRQLEDDLPFAIRVAVQRER